MTEQTRTRPKAFFNKAKPQSASIAEFCKNHGRVFLGYPKRKDESRKWAQDTDILNPACEELPESYEGKQQYTKNRNHVLAVDKAHQADGDGAYFLVPNIKAGICYVGKVTGNFSIQRDDDIAQKYIDLRQEQKLACDPKEHFIADVRQHWKVDFKEVPFLQIPTWMSYQICGRTTAGEIHPQPGVNDLTPGQIAKEMYNGKWKTDLSWTKCKKEIRNRLERWTNPTSFEHLAVSLLQIEATQGTRWRQVGGTGDGGADGLAITENGEHRGVLQCKWKTTRKALEKTAAELKSVQPTTESLVYAAYLLIDKEFPPEDTCIKYLDGEWFARKLAEHWEKVPQAIGLGIGQASPGSEPD